MKMTVTHYNTLKTQISALPRDKVLAHKALGLGVDKQKRYVWDIYSAASRSDGFALQKELYEYLHNNHIETALKRIVAELALDH
jgi:hypothetical protein